jgi:hypothetical protein
MTTFGAPAAPATAISARTASRRAISAARLTAAIATVKRPGVPKRNPDLSDLPPRIDRVVDQPSDPAAEHDQRQHAGRLQLCELLT